LWRAVGIRERGYLRDMVKGMCGVEVRCCALRGRGRDWWGNKRKDVVLQGGKKIAIQITNRIIPTNHEIYVGGVVS
jgi:hypothetical protein